MGFNAILDSDGKLAKCLVVLSDETAKIEKEMAGSWFEKRWWFSNAFRKIGSDFLNLLTKQTES
jgi:hypothetical protein